MGEKAATNLPGTNEAPSSLDRTLRAEQLQAVEDLRARLGDSEDSLHVLGFVSNEQGDSAAAIRYWDASLRQEPDATRLYDRADTWYNLGYAYLLREDYDQAISALRESFRLNPRRQETSFRLAHALFLQGKMEEALRALDEGKVGTPLGWRLRGQAHQQLGQLEEARGSYEKAIQLAPNMAEAYYGLTTTCARLGDTAKAEEYRQRFDALKSEGQAMGRQARTDFDPVAIARASLAQTHTELGRVYLAHRQPQAAEKLFLRAAEVDTNNTGCRFQLVMLYQQAQRNADALRVCQEMVRAEPRNAFHYLSLGNLHSRLKQAAEAEGAFKQVIALAPNRAEGYFALAQMYLQSNTQPAEALRLAERAVGLSASPVNYYILSQARARNGDLPAAREAIEQACRLDPRNTQYEDWRSTLQPKP